MEEKCGLLHRNYSHTLYIQLYLRTTFCWDPEMLLLLQRDMLVCLFPNLRNCQLEPDGELVPPLPQRTNVCKTLRHCRTIPSFFFYKPPSNLAILLFFRLSFQYQKREVQRLLQSWFRTTCIVFSQKIFRLAIPAFFRFRCYWTYARITIILYRWRISQ